jgi:hypothetical protein
MNHQRLMQIAQAGRAVADRSDALFPPFVLGVHNVRSRIGLAWVHTRQKDYAATLARFAEVLARLAQQHQQEQLCLANRVNTAGPAAGGIPPASRDGQRPAAAPAMPPGKHADAPRDETKPAPTTTTTSIHPWPPTTS